MSAPRRSGPGRGCRGRAACPARPARTARRIPPAGRTGRGCGPGCRRTSTPPRGWRRRASARRRAACSTGSRSEAASRSSPPSRRQPPPRRSARPAATASPAPLLPDRRSGRRRWTRAPGRARGGGWSAPCSAPRACPSRPGRRRIRRRGGRSRPRSGASCRAGRRPRRSSGRAATARAGSSANWMRRGLGSNGFRFSATQLAAASSPGLPASQQGPPLSRSAVRSRPVRFAAATPLNCSGGAGGTGAAGWYSVSRPTSGTSSEIPSSRAYSGKDTSGRCGPRRTGLLRSGAATEAAVIAHATRRSSPGRPPVTRWRTIPARACGRDNHAGRRRGVDPEAAHLPARARGLPGRAGARRRGGAAAIRRAAGRPGGARRDAAPPGRARGVPPPAHRLGRPDHHADRPRRRGRQGARPRARRRRLHHQAVLDPRVPQPHPGRAAAGDPPRRAARPARGPDRHRQPRDRPRQAGGDGRRAPRCS